MAFMTPEVNGARQELPYLDSPEVNGARQEVAVVKKYVDGAWVEVWASEKWFEPLSNTIPYGVYSPEDDGNKLLYWKLMDRNDDGTYWGTISGSGKLIVYVDGSWETPNISFDYAGGFIRNSGAAGTPYQQSTAGKISLYGVEMDGTEQQVTAVAAVGKNGTGDGYASVQQGSYDGEAELPGKFWRLGLIIEPAAYTGYYYGAALEIAISNVRINGRKVGFSPNIIFDNQQMW